MLRFIVYVLVSILTVFFFLAVNQYLFSPNYQFVPGEPFRGDSLYNPYQDIARGPWVRSNFHAHARAWGGLTNGKGTAEDIWVAYDSMGYGIHSVSDYQKINRYGDSSPAFITAYEHGYNLNKTHQLVIGDSEVVWTDFFFLQTRHNKQRMLELLGRHQDNIIVLNHPEMRASYTQEDLRVLTGFDCIELLNPASKGFIVWEQALNSGRKVFVIGNDDVHKVHKRSSIGRYYTLIQTDTNSRKAVLGAIRKGRTIAVAVPEDEKRSFSERINLLNASDPSLARMEMVRDTLQVDFTRRISEITLHGQGGVQKLRLTDTNRLVFPFGERETYLRLSYRTSDGFWYYLNPVFRFNGRWDQRSIPQKQYSYSAYARYAAGALLLVFWLTGLRRMLRRRLGQKR